MGRWAVLLEEAVLMPLWSPDSQEEALRILVGSLGEARGIS